MRVRYATYESNEEMLAKVLSGNSGWDVVFPTHNRLKPMREYGLLQPLNHAWLAGLQNLDARFRAPAWDPGLQWGVPYMWNGTGIVYRRGYSRLAEAVGGSVGPAAEGPADHAGRSGGHAGGVSEEAADFRSARRIRVSFARRNGRRLRRSRCCART